MESAKTSKPAGVATQPQRKLSAKEILADLREGISDRDLEQKYRLTPDGREKVFKTLIAKGLMTEAEFQWRSKLLKSQEASGSVPSPPPISTLISPASHTDETPVTLTESPSTPDSKSSPIASDFREGAWTEDRKSLVLFLVFISPLGLYGLWKTSQFPRATKAILAVITVALGIALWWIAIPVWIVAGIVIVLWGRLKGAKQRVTQVAGTALQTMPKAQEALKGAKQRITQVASPLRRSEQTGVPGQPAPVTQAARSNDPVSVEEIEEAIKRMQKARRDMFGIAGDVGIAGLGLVGGGGAAGIVAAFFGATSIWGLTTAGAFLGLSIVGKTPWLFIIGCAIGGAALAFGVSRLIRSGAQGDERRKRNIDELRIDIEKRRKAAEKSNVDKEKFGKLQESLTMLLSNGKITPEESDGLIEGIKSGTTSYEFAFSFIEELLQE